MMGGNVRTEINQQEFETFLMGRPGGPPQRPSQAERNALFEEFLQWRQRKGAQAR